MRWIPYTMVRIAAFFIAGIAAGIHFPDWIHQETLTFFLNGLVLLYFLFWILLRTSMISGVLLGAIGLGAVFIAGALNTFLRSESNDVAHIIHIHDRVAWTRLKLVSAIEEKNKSWKAVAEIKNIKIGKRWQRASGKVNLYWAKTENVSNLGYGDVVVVRGGPREVEGPYNPGEFDFKRFLYFRNIFHQQFLRSGDWVLAEKSTDKGFLYYSALARTWSIQAIRRNVSAPQEQGIVMALVLGVVDGVDNDLRSAYAASGAMHVLAVSGLHVSIIYGVILFFLGPVNKGKGMWVVAGLSLILLWGYAFLTGLSASVLRAVTMFSFVVVAKPIGRHTNIYNTLAASAFCLLLHDPFLLMSVGFQLSYMAVLGIVYLQRPIYNLWEPKSWFTDWAWKLSCVSIAAQIITFPLGLYYFHQFPVYFLVSNLFVIPGSFVVLLGGILLLTLSPFSAPASWLGVALEMFVKVINEGIFLVERWPFSVIDGIYISPLQCWLLMVLVAATIAILQYRNFFGVTLATVCIFIFSTISWLHFQRDVTPSAFAVYRVQGHSALEWSEAGHAFFVSDSALTEDKIKFHIEGARLSKGVSVVEPRQVRDFFFWGGKSFLRITNSRQRFPKNLKVDYLVISSNAVKDPKTLISTIDFEHLIFDSSNSHAYCNMMMREFAKMRVPCTVVPKQGAFFTNL